MLKKLQDLLFEDDDDDYIDDEDEEEAAEEKKPEPVETKKAEPKPQPAPVQTVKSEQAPLPKEENNPLDHTVHLNRIDVTGAFETQPQEAANTVKFPELPKEEKKSIGITADDTFRKSGEKKEVHSVKAHENHHARKEDSAPSYEFQPVISPIFGVDEKDMDALKTTTQKVASMNQAKEEDDTNITPVISPIYGATGSLRTVTPEEEAAGAAAEEKTSAPAEENKPSEDDFGEFSLDDILRTRDEEYSDSMDNDDDLFPDLNFDDIDKPEADPDQTTIIDKTKVK